MSGRYARVLAAAAAVFLFSMQVQAQDADAYPSRPIKIVVPYAAGGITDTVARLIATKLTEAWKQPVIVENRLGAGGLIGNEAVAKAPGDGYTVLVGITQIIQAPSLYKKLNYDVFTELTPLSLLTYSYNLFVLPAASPATTLKDYVALVKANPGKYNFGSFGAATSAHLHGELLNSVAGLDLAHTPYKGAAPLLNDILGNHVSSGFVDLATAHPQLASGKIKVLAITGPRRSRLLPQVATFGEQGYPGFEPVGWTGAFVPASTPKPIAAKLAAEIGRIMHLPDVLAKLDVIGAEAVGNSPEEFATVIRTDFPKWAKMIKDARVSLD
jgi:tripartite-type tricarboxylate transporter receptor subunit TctC